MKNKDEMKLYKGNHVDVVKYLASFDVFQGRVDGEDCAGLVISLPGIGEVYLKTTERTTLVCEALCTLLAGYRHDVQ